MTTLFHLDTLHGFDNPVLALTNPDGQVHEFLPCGQDAYGPMFEVNQPLDVATIRFKQAGDAPDTPWEDPRLERRLAWGDAQPLTGSQFWCRSHHAFLYPYEPATVQPQTSAEVIQGLDFSPQTYIPSTGALTGLGAHVTRDHRVLFSFFHPTAARVYVCGDFNQWQHPGHPQPNPAQFVELKLHRGYFDAPNIWLAVSERAKPGDRYRYYIQGGSLHDGEVVDPFSRTLSDEIDFPASLIVDPAGFGWRDAKWETPAITDLILYELQVWGFTHDDPNVQPHNRGLFDGVSERIENGYFEQLGANALSLMPINEFSGMQGANTLGYNTSVFPAIERDFGLPDDLRRMVNVAHRNGLAVAADMVFNHADNSFNPLWNLILEHPDEAAQKGNGGLFFSGETPWGNRVATERVEVQNFLIDVCKLMLHEYHLDGFRFDFTHSSLMSHEFLHRLADELQAFHPQVLLIAENLPNERNLNREGFNGFAQWSNAFHDKLKAMLRQADFEGQLPDFAGIGDIFYFSKSGFAAHTNNVVNYVESHDENSVSFEVATNPSLNLPDTKERKSRLGLFASIVALGTPMIYMGQEYQLERERNLVACPWPENPDDSHFFNWSSALLKLRRRYPALHLHGFDPIADGQFAWILGGFLPDPRRGGGCKLVGWRAQPNGKAHEAMVVLLNFEANDVTVDVDFGIPGVWVQLATLDYVHDVPPYSDNGPQDEKAIRTEGVFANFVLPSSSGLIYKWVADLDA